MSSPIRKQIEAMADTWIAVGILLNAGHCLRKGKVVWRIVGLDADNKIVKVMPVLKNIESKYPAHYPMYTCLASDRGLHRDPEFIKQLKGTGVLREDDRIVK